MTPSTSDWRNWRHEILLVGLLLGLVSVGAWLLPGFLSPRQQWYLSRHLWEIALLAPAMTLIIIAAGVDLSVGANMGLCAIVFGLTWQQTHSSLAATLACVLCGTLAGTLNGWLIAWFEIHPLIITLATSAAFRGMAEGLSQGAVYTGFEASFADLAQRTWLGVPWAGWLFVVLACGTAAWLSNAPSGRWLYAIGHNARAVRFSGIPIRAIRLALYAWMGAWVGIATLVYVARFNTAQADVGRGMELDVITAVVVGGTNIFGGRGNMLGMTLGLVLIHELRQWVGRYWGIDELKSIVVGVLLVGSMLASQWAARKESD